MPSPIAHAIAGYGIYRFIRSRPTASSFNQPTYRSFWTVIFFSLLPDVDAVVGLIMGDLGKYHNNLMNSPFCACLVASCFTLFVWLKTKSNPRFLFTISFFPYVTHILMDYFTVGRGVMLLWPLSRARFSPPIAVFYGLRWSDGWLSRRHLWTLFTEFAFVLAILGILQTVRKSLRADKAS